MRENNQELEVAAAYWFAKARRGVMSIDDRTDYDTWRADPDNARALEALAAVWRETGALSLRSTRRHVVTRAAAVAAICAMTLGLGAISADAGVFWTKLDWVDR